tara:strand:+ start:788 stop:910 length:123 start_codon:yes stop_codon:yes gene_type:complete
VIEERKKSEKRRKKKKEEKICQHEDNLKSVKNIISKMKLT